MNIDTKLTLPRVDTGADPEQVAALQEILHEADLAEAHRRKELNGMVHAMLRLRMPVARRTRKPAKPMSAHRRRNLNGKIRSAYLKSVAA